MLQALVLWLISEERAFCEMMFSFVDTVVTQDRETLLCQLNVWH